MYIRVHIMKVVFCEVLWENNKKINDKKNNENKGKH